MGGIQPQVNDANLAKAEWQQKQLQTWKKNNQHTYWTAYYVGLAIKKLMILLELGGINERFGKTTYISQLLA